MFFFFFGGGETHSTVTWDDDARIIGFIAAGPEGWTTGGRGADEAHRSPTCLTGDDHSMLVLMGFNIGSRGIC